MITFRFQISKKAVFYPSCIKEVFAFQYVSDRAALNVQPV